MLPSREDGGDCSCAAIIPVEQYRGGQWAAFKTARTVVLGTTAGSDPLLSDSLLKHASLLMTTTHVSPCVTLCSEQTAPGRFHVIDEPAEDAPLSREYPRLPLGAADP